MFSQEGGEINKKKKLNEGFASDAGEEASKLDVSTFLFPGFSEYQSEHTQQQVLVHHDQPAAAAAAVAAAAAAAVAAATHRRREEGGDWSCNRCFCC